MLKETPAVCSAPPPPPGGLQVTCEYMAQQEGVLCEEVLLLSESNDDVCVKVKVHARVMGKIQEHISSLQMTSCHILLSCYGLKWIFCPVCCCPLVVLLVP